MAMSVVRCPFCDRRYNVTGIPSGTKVLCTSCRATLTVPAARQPFRAPWWRRILPESASAQITLGLIGGLVVATVAYVAIRSKSQAAAEIAIQPERRETAPPATTRPTDRERVSAMTRPEQIERFTQDIYSEFGVNRFQVDVRGSSFMIAGEMAAPERRLSMTAMFDEFQGALQNLQARFREEFGVPLQLGEPAEMLRIVVFTSKESFDEYLRRTNNSPLPPEVPGVYEYSKRRVVFLHEQRGYPFEVLLHEATHQLLHYYVRQRAGADKDQSWWLQEGMAVYFEQFRLTTMKQVVVEPSLSSPRLATLREASRNGPRLDLYQLMGLTIEEIWSHWIPQQDQDRMRMTQLCYAKAWALVHYLRHGAGGKYRPLFDEYLKAELEGRGGKSEFERLLLEKWNIQLQHLERELDEYVARM